MLLEKRKLVISVLSVIIILLAWQCVAWLAYLIRGVEFPTPIDTFMQLFGNLKGNLIYDFSIWEHTITSLIRWLVAYTLAVIIGVFIGFALGVNVLLNKLLMPFLTVIQLIPGLAWIPIALLLFGLGNTSTIFMIFIIALTPIVITTATGIKNTPSDLIHAAQIMGANKRKLFVYVLFPSALFHIVDGMRIGLANSWRVLIAAEMIVGSGVGLGYIIIQSRWTLDYTSAFVAIVVIVIIGLTAEKLIFKRIEDNLRKKYGYEISNDSISFE